MCSVIMAQMSILRCSFYLILTISPQLPLAQYLGLDHSFGALGVNSSWPQEDHISEPDYIHEDMENYEEKDKPEEMLSLQTLWGDFSEMENLMKQFEKEGPSQESQNNGANMTMDGAVKIILPRLKQVQQFINTKSNNSQILTLMEEILGKWGEEIAGEVGANNLGLKELIEVLKEVVDGIKLSLGGPTVENTFEKLGKLLVDKVGTKNAQLKESVDELKGVVHKIKLENANKQELFGKLVEKLMKVVDGMNVKSSNMEKVTVSIIFNLKVILISDNQGIEDAFEKWGTQIVDKVDGQNTGLKKMVEKFDSENAGLKKSVEQINTQNTELKKMVDKVGGQNTGLNKMIERINTQNTGLKKMVEKFGSENTGLKKSVDGLKGVIDGIKLSSETKNAEVQKAVGGLKNVAEGMKENFGKMEKVESSRSFKIFKAWNCINFFPGS